MCGRATLTREDPDKIAEDVGADLALEDARLYRPRYNMAPTDLGWIVEARGDRRALVPAIWGYRVSSGRALINVRGEQVTGGGGSGGLREAFAARRCVVVTDGFLEWDKDKAPFWYHREEPGGLVLLGGLWQPPAGDAPPGKPELAGRPRFTILTTRPNALVSRVHDRMPVIVAPDRLDDWLRNSAPAAASLVAPAPEDALIATRVSKRVGSVRNDDPACLVPEAGEPASSARQRSLF